MNTLRYTFFILISTLYIGHNPLKASSNDNQFNKISKWPSQITFNNQPGLTLKNIILRMDQQDNEIKQLKQENVEQNIKINQQNLTINKLTNENRQQNFRINNLENDKRQLNVKINNLNLTINNLTNENTQLKKNINKLTRENKQKDEKINELEKKQGGASTGFFVGVGTVVVGIVGSIAYLAAKAGDEDNND